VRARRPPLLVRVLLAVVAAALIAVDAAPGAALRCASEPSAGWVRLDWQVGRWGQGRACLTRSRLFRPSLPSSSLPASNTAAALPKRKSSSSATCGEGAHACGLEHR
jgi:hypothetical protein